MWRTMWSRKLSLSWASLKKSRFSKEKQLMISSLLQKASVSALWRMRNDQRPLWGHCILDSTSVRSLFWQNLSAQRPFRRKTTRPSAWCKQTTLTNSSTSSQTSKRSSTTLSCATKTSTSNGSRVKSPTSHTFRDSEPSPSKLWSTSSSKNSLRKARSFSETVTNSIKSIFWRMGRLQPTCLCTMRTSF